MSRKNKRKNDFIPYEKMSKKDKKERNNEKRNDWGNFNPVTRKENKNKYKERKKKQEEKDFEEEYAYYGF